MDPKNKKKNPKNRKKNQKNKINFFTNMQSSLPTTPT